MRELTKLSKQEKKSEELLTALMLWLADLDELAMDAATFCWRGPGALYKELPQEDDEYEDIVETGLDDER